MSLIAELKRRKVFKVGAAYLVVGWLVIEVASTVLPQFEIPSWGPRLVTLLVALGLPIALVMAWIFDVTPEGIKAERPSVGNRTMFAVAAVLAVLALGWYFRGAVPGQGAESGVKPRLAVLPLDNFSPDPANAFFADGLHDDMLTALSRLKGVDVISRTTMDTFRDSKLTLGEIAAKIGATHVLEGSVRRDADHVRLTVQLIDARSDDHIWADTYDRTLDASLTLQSEVAAEVARALDIAIARGSSDAPPTSVPAAYDLYLKARLAVQDGGGPQVKALQYFDAALLLDPKFSLARAERVRAACSVLWFDGSRRAELAAQAKADLEQVRTEAPDLVELHLSDSAYDYYIVYDLPAALRKVEAVLAERPDYPEAIEIYAYLLRRMGRMDEALVALRRSASLDPYNRHILSGEVELLQQLRRYPEAIAVQDQVIAQKPEDWGAKFYRARLRYEATGDGDAYLASAADLRPAMPEDVYENLRRYLTDASDTAVTREQLASSVARSREWSWRPGGFAAPVAFEAAWSADFLGDVAERDRQVAIAQSMMATQQPQPAAVSRILAYEAGLLALQGDSAGTIAKGDAALARAHRDNDAMLTQFVELAVAYGLARIGERSRAMDLLEAIVSEPYTTISEVDLTRDDFFRKWLGDDPRYQALIQKLRSRFVKL